MAAYVLLLSALFAVVLIKIALALYRQSQFAAIVDKIPGPKAYPIVGNSFTDLRVSREDQQDSFWALSRKYKGGIFRTWVGLQPHVHLTTPETVSVVFRSKTLITKSDNYVFVEPWIGKGLITSTGEKWHQHRKLISPSFHFDILERFAVVMSEKTEILLHCIASEVKKNPDHPVDMHDHITKCALDIISETAMGFNMNAQKNPQVEYATALKRIAAGMIERMTRPWLYPDWIYYLSSRGKNFMKAVQISHELTTEVLNKRIMERRMQKQNPDDFSTGKPKRKAFLDHLLDACDNEAVPLTERELREEGETFMFAGHDTTASATSWAIFCIGNLPDIQEKIHQELFEVFGDSTETATTQQLSKLYYLDRVIKEALRLFPVVPWLGRKITEDTEIAGYIVPKGAVVRLHIFNVHLDPNHWPKPEKFDPDRFLPENCQGRHPYAFVPFSAGARNCIGQKFALLEEKIMLTAILRKWRVRSLLKMHESKFYSEIVLRSQNGTKIYLTPK